MSPRLSVSPLTAFFLLLLGSLFLFTLWNSPRVRHRLVRENDRISGAIFTNTEEDPPRF